MLGKHVNVSARNRKLMHKVLCAFMAIVLVGLMVPHGLAAQLNAYAGNEAEQTEVQANPEEGVTTEEPSFAESTESNAISYSVSVTFGKNAAGQDIYIDNTDGQAESTIPQGWQKTEAGGKITALTLSLTSQEEAQVPTFNTLISELNVYTPGRDGAGFITNVDENCTLQDFIYDKDRKGNHLNEKPEDGHATYEIIPFYSTYIDVKPGTMDPAISNPVLKYYFDGAFNPYAGWPTTSTQINYIQNATEYTINPTTHTLTVTGLAERGPQLSHKVDDFIAILESENYSFSTFTTTGTGKVTPGLEFTGTWTEKDVPGKLLTDQTEGKLPAGVELFTSTDGEEFTKVTEGMPLSITVKPSDTFKTVSTITDYDSVILVGGTYYGFKLTGTQYRLNGWTYANIETAEDWNKVTDEDTTVGQVNGLFLKIALVENTTVKFLTNFTDKKLPEGVELYKSVNGAAAVKVTTIPFTEFDFPSTTFKSINDFTGYENAIQIGNIKYGFKLTDAAKLKYKIKQWGYSHEEAGSYTPIGENETSVGNEDLFIRAEIETLPVVSFAHNLGSAALPTAITFYKEGATVGADPIPVTITEKLYLGENVKFNYTTAPEGYTGAFLLDGKKYFFKITTAAGVPADYEYCKWEYTMGGVTKEIKSETTITSDVVFKATFDVKVSFVVSPTKTPAWGVIHDNNKNVVDHAYVTPGDNVKFTTANITLHEKDYYAVASQGCEFVSWSTDPASLEVAPTTPFKLIATFGQTPIVKFAIESSDGQKEVKDYVTITDKNGQVVDITKAVAGLKIGSKYALDSTKNTVLVIDEQTFTVTVNEHYVALGDYVWYLDKGASADTPVDTKATELKSEDNITLVAKAKRVDNLTATGTIECSNPEKATVRADVIMNAGSPDEAIVDTQFPTVGTDGKYVVNNVPLNVSIRVYVDNATHNVGDTKTEVKKDNVTIPTVKLTKDYSFSFGKLANKVWPSDNNSNKTITTSYGTQKEGYYNFAEGSKLVLNASKVGDTITFANLKGAVGGQIQIGNQTPIKFEGRFASGTIGADDVDSDGNVTITILAAVDVDLIAVHAVERVVTFAVDKAEGSYANGTFKKDGAEVKSVKVNGLGVTYSVTEDLLTFSDNQKVIATPDGKSLFRHWNVSGTDVLEDITISAKFVQEFVNVKFEKSSSSATDAEVPAAAQIHMDSVYQPNASYQSTILAKPSFVYDSVSTAFDVKVKEADQIMYKFAAKPFEDLTNGNTINEEKYPTIEKDGLTLKYITEKRSTYTVTIDLLGGNLVSPYTIPVVDSSLGGSGEWTADTTKTKYTNTFFEEYPFVAAGVYAKGIIEWLTTDVKTVDRYDGFFKGTWTGPKTGTLTANTTWTADYNMAHHIKGTVTDKVSTDPIKDMTVTATANKAVPIAPSKMVVTDTTTGEGKYDIKLYEGADCTVQVGDKTHIEQSQSLVLGTEDYTLDFSLDKGYTFIPKDYDDSSSTWNAMFEAGKSFTATDTTKTNTVNVAKNGALTYSKNNTLQAGDKFVIDVETSASFVTINNGFDEVVEVNDGKIEYRVWNIEKDVTITASDAALSISRIDYYVVEPGSVITYAGVVKDKITTNPIGDVDVKFVSTQANETVETRTNDNGEYYLLLSSPATGVITYVDGDYLDEKVELNNETSSKTNVDEDLVQAIHVTGIVYYEDWATKEVRPAKNVTVSYTDDEASEYNPWSDDYHGAVNTGDDGSYILKLRKSNAVSGGVVWFNLNGYAQGKYILKDFDLNPIVHDDDIDEIGDTLVAAGADVSVVGDVDEGHEIFNVKNYLYGVCIADFYTVTSEALTFAAAGEFYAGYDEFGNHILKYVYNPEQTDPEEYVTTLRAVAQEDYTFWAWRCYDPTTDTTSTLYDDQPIYLSYPTSNPYVFTADYAEAADVTVGGNGSVGHAGWVMDVTFGEDVEPFHSTIGTSDYTFKFPITQNQNSNETTEPISVGYTFDGSAFSLNLESEFVSSEGGDSVEYVENRAFTPIPAEGYMFTGISVNGHDLAVGETAEIVDTTDLNVVAKYAEIPNPASTGDSTPNMWWLVGLAVLAMLGVAYGASRKQKGIRC